MLSLFSRKQAPPPAPVKRLRLELDLQSLALPALPPRPGITWQRWRRELADTHATLLFQGFLGEEDSTVLPSLATLDGCRDLMRRAVGSGCLIPEGTWLALAREGGSDPCPCGAVQSVSQPGNVARIMNLAVVPEWRGRGIGRGLLVRALRQCRALGFWRAQLDVTASNRVALGLYRSLGFKRRSVFYHQTDAAPLD